MKWKKRTHHTLDMRSRDHTSQTAMKDWKDSYYTGAEKTGELHDLFSFHHRANGNGVYMPVGDISMVEGRGALK